MKQLILASQSPRRKELLATCNIPFIVEAADLNEEIDVSKPLVEEIKKLAALKAETILERHPDGIVIGSDTIVVCDGLVLGKPKDRNDARYMLQMLSGHTHQVITGICIVSDQKKYVDASVSNVTFASLDVSDIETYLETGEADDKAGAYGIQGQAGKFITHIDGDYYAIMGFPISLVYQELKNIELY